MVQTARPIADVSNDGPWVPSSGSDLYAMLDEESPSDADYVESPDAPEGDTFVVELGPLEEPGEGDQVLTVRIEWTGSGDPATVICSLYQGARFIARKTVVPTGSFVDYSHTLTAEQAAKIVYPDRDPVESLELHVTAIIPVVSGGAVAGGEDVLAVVPGGGLGGGPDVLAIVPGGGIGGGPDVLAIVPGGGIGGGPDVLDIESGGAIGGGDEESE